MVSDDANSPSNTARDTTARDIAFDDAANSDGTDDLIAFIASRALDVLTEPRNDAEPVVNLASPDELVHLFSRHGGLRVDPADKLDQDSLRHSVDLAIEKSVHTAHRRFFNQNFAGADPIAVVGDWLSAALNTTMATYEMAPVFTLMENAVLGRLAELIGYRPVTSNQDNPLAGLTEPAGIMCPGGSTANLMALQLARHRKRPDSIKTGTGSDRLTVFTSSSGHYSTAKAAAVLGIGTDAVIKVPDRDGSIDVKALATAVKASAERGEIPFALVATAGTTVTGAFDDLVGMSEVAENHDLWLHVDACFGGAAIFSKRHRHLLDGVGRTDSFVWNPHKMMGLTQQCTMLAVAEPSRLEACFSSRADYLFQPDKLNSELDTGDRTLLCARRVDSFKLWLTWKARGESSFESRLDHAVGLADYTRSAITSSPRFSALVPGRFANVVFLWMPPGFAEVTSGGDVSTLTAEQRKALHDLAPRVKARMQTEGTAMVGYQPIDGLNAFRLLFMNPLVTTDDVDATLGLIDRYSSEEWQALTGS